MHNIPYDVFIICVIYENGIKLHISILGGLKQTAVNSITKRYVHSQYVCIWLQTSNLTAFPETHSFPIFLEATCRMLIAVCVLVYTNNI